MDGGRERLTGNERSPFNLLVSGSWSTSPAIPPLVSVKTGLGWLFKVQSIIYKVMTTDSMAAGATFGLNQELAG